ncbi:MAG: DNA polymerase III subunit epsilon [Gammaproteobacteria bacterium]|nr:DNA polymerase III subunit epsilon [Gammaproteobacteria bacterium]
MRIREDKLVFLDLETTGGNASRHRIIEIGLIEFVAGQKVREWSSFVNPDCAVPPFIQNYTGIDETMLADAPAFEQLAPSLLDILDGGVLVAHNARFDYGFLRNEFRRADLRLSMPTLCTVKLARAMYPGHKSYSLDALIERHDIDCAGRHRALGDARAMLDFFEIARHEHGDKALEAAAVPQLRRPTLPPALDPEIVSKLPGGPGVYLFYDAAGRLLYVGKSVNLRARVLSHFSADHAVHKDMRISAQLADVRCIQTAGELGALLTEARLVKEASPVHNRRLRRQSGMFTFSLDTDGEFHRAVLLGESDLDTSEPGANFGLFRSKRAANNALKRICTRDGLCLRRSGIEKGSGPCFAYQLGRCRGACAGRESALMHNIRLAAALAGLRLSAWPFSGTIGLRESDPIRGRQAIHVFDNWCWLGSAERTEDLRPMLEDGAKPKFDLDVYRILKSWLRRNADRCEIIRLDDLRQPAASSA